MGTLAILAAFQTTMAPSSEESPPVRFPNCWYFPAASASFYSSMSAIASDQRRHSSPNSPPPQDRHLGTKAPMPVVRELDPGSLEHMRTHGHEEHTRTRTCRRRAHASLAMRAQCVFFFFFLIFFLQHVQQIVTYSFSTPPYDPICSHHPMENRS